ncbi:CD276 antigen homolog [Electrophorus electricus]|uniref:CD276 antigen homolog n=1 Tax=Electrophorus electricus TaxID=8005 RepID=UPI0015D03CF3|nr:CD276 antigen homolog [Electrophorus electricus]
MSNRYASDKTILRGCFYFLFLLLIHSVSLENVHVVAIIGSTVILPCSNNDKHESTVVFWRYNDSKVVLDINGGSVSLENQEVVYSGRVDSFPEEYMKKGNFSIKLRDVKLSDAGTYSCFMPQVGVHTKLDLIVKERESSDWSDRAGNGDVRGRSNSVLLLFTSLLGFIVLHP